VPAAVTTARLAVAWADLLADGRTFHRKRMGGHIWLVDLLSLAEVGFATAAVA